MNNLIEYAKKSRNMNNVHVKISIDGGRDFLKLTLSFQSTAIPDQSEDQSNV